MRAAIRDIAYHLPERVVTNAELGQEHPEWGMEKIGRTTGITSRRVAAPDEYGSDLATAAGRALFARGACRPDEVDYILYCTMTPDYVGPATACLVQDRLGVPKR